MALKLWKLLIVCFQSLIFKEEHDVYLMRLAVCIVSCIIFNCAQVLIKFILTIEIERMRELDIVTQWKDKLCPTKPITSMENGQQIQASC